MTQCKRNPILENVTREADTLATRFWERAASDRGLIYKEWLNCLKKATIEVKKTQFCHNLPHGKGNKINDL